LHGNAPDRCPLALVLIDVISDFEFPGGAELYRAARRAAQPLARLKARAQRAGVPCIYANDNFGRWRSDFAAQVQHCTRDGARGKSLVELLAPGARDYFVLKPKHSAFYQTCLSLLLDHLGARTLVLAGFSTDICVSMTAVDAYLRDYSLVVVRDATASRTRAAHTGALTLMRTALKARTPKAADVDLGRRARRARPED
jgi:nicotinamidase-related amidase